MSLRFQAYVSEDIAKQLRAYCSSTGKTYSSVMTAALNDYFDETSNTKLLFRRLDKQSRALNKANRDLQLLAEAFSVFVKIWFAHTPNIPESDKNNARMYAEKRFQQYCEHVAKQYTGGHYFVEDLVSDNPISDEQLKSSLEEYDDN